jgi:hypothetical protein
MPRSPRPPRAQPCSPPRAAADWTQFRGPDGSGAVPDAVLPTALGPRKHITWEIPLPGRGLASPIIVGDRVFVTARAAPSKPVSTSCASARATA